MLVTQLCLTLCDPVDCSSRQEYWSGFTFSSPGALPDPGFEPGSPALQGGSLPSGHKGSPFQGVWAASIFNHGENASVLQ